MKKNIKSLVAVVLSVMLLAMLPISVMAESIPVTLDYNSEYFVEKGNMHTKQLPTYLYNGAKMPSGNTVSIAGSEATYDFSFDATVLSINKNDVLEITNESQTVTLSKNPAKCIGIIANTSQKVDTSAEFKLTFDDESTKTFNVTVNSMFTQGTYSYDYGKSLTADSTTGLIKRYNTESDTVYFNLIEIKTDSIKNVSSVEFGKADSDYHVIGVVEISYTQNEIDEIKNQATTGLLPLYENKTLEELLEDISEEDMENLGKLVGSLDTNHEKYKHIYNLYNGYILFTAQKEIKDRYDEIMKVKDYLNETAENIDESDSQNLLELTELYNMQEKSDRNTLQAAMEYFNMTADIFLDLSEKEIIEELNSEYLVLKEHKELLEEIETLYKEYKDKKTSDLDESDIDNLNKLIDNYNKADNKGILYDKADREYIQRLLDNYPKYLKSTEDYYYDLSSYFNKGFTVEAGKVNLPDYWGTTDRFTVNGTAATYTTGIRKSVWDASHTDGIVVATSANYQKETSVITPNPGNLPTAGEFKFKISTESDITDKNIVELKGSSIVIPGSGRMAKNFNFLSMVGTQSRLSTFEITLNYTDGTAKIWSVGLPYNGWEQPAVAKLDDRTRPYVIDGEVVLSSVRTVSRATVLPVESGKIIDNVVIKGASATECVLLAVTEEMLSNEEYEAVLLQQYNKVKDYTDNNFDKIEATKFSLYCEEGEKRGIDISKIVDIEKANEINMKVMTAENKFAKIDKDTVTSTISFTQPVNQDELAVNLTVLKNGKETKDYKLEMKDEKTAVVEFDDEPFGGDLYKVVVSENLPIKKFPNFTILKAYEFTYTSPAYIEATLSGNTLAVKNNTETDFSYVAVATAMSEDNVYCNVAFEDEAAALDTNTHIISSKEGSFFASIWDENQKFILNVAGPAEVTASQTVSTADYMYPSLDFETNELKIAGITPSKEENKNITLDILKGSDSFIKKEAVTNKDGYFEIVISLNETLIPTPTTLSFTLGGDDFETKVSLKSVYFSIQDQRIDRIDRLSKASESEVATILKDTSTKDILALDAQIYDNIDLDKAVHTVYANKSLFSTSDIAGSRDNLRRLLILSAFNQGKKDLVSKDGIFLYEDVMNYSSIDDENVTIYSLYKNLVSKAGREVTVDSLLNKNYLTVDALIKDMAENMLINELEYPNVSSVGFVSDVLTTQNAAKISLLIPKYFAIADKTSINIAIVSALITSKSTIETVVNNFAVLSAPIGGGTSSSGGGFSGGSSGVSNLGVDRAYLDNVTNKNNESNGATAFKDVLKNHWAYEYITELYEKKILSGKGEGSFAPEDGLTRAELVKIIVTAKDLKSTGTILPFTDVPFDSWYAPFVKAAYENGIITGISDTLFAPDEKVSRQDLCVVLYRLLNDKKSGEISFNDIDSIAPYAIDAVKCFVNLGIINGFEDGSFKPTEGCTRAQCAKIISMFIQQ